MCFILENGNVRLEIDKDTGVIRGLKNLETGWEVIANPKSGEIMRLLVPVPGYRNNKVISSLQQPKHIEQKGSDALVINWEGLEGDKSGFLDIYLRLEITLRGNQIYFRAEMENRSPYTIEELWIPYLVGLDRPGGESNMYFLTMNMQGGATIPILGEPINFMDEFPKWPFSAGYWGVDYPTFIVPYPSPACIAPFCIWNNGKQGMVCIVGDENAINAVAFYVDLRPGLEDSMYWQRPYAREIGGWPVGYTFSPVRLPFLRPGERAVFAPVILSLFRGDWHAGVDIYRAWRNKWFNKKPAPRWTDEVDAWLTLHINSPEDCCRYRFPQLVEICKEAKENGVGALQLIGWNTGGQDRGLPAHDPDPRLGTRKEFVEALRAIEQMGVKVLLFSKFLWADRTTEQFKEELYRYAVRDIYGNYRCFEGYAYQTISQLLKETTRELVPMCHACKGYQEICLQEMEKIINYGTSGTLCDEAEAGHGRLLCFAEDHGHKPGLCHVQGSLEIARLFYELIQKKNPDFALAGEGPEDYFCQYYSITYVRSWSPLYLPVQRYLDNRMKIATCVTGWNDRNMINQCLLYGYIINYEPFNFKGRVTDFPDTLEYGKRAQAFRRRLWNYIWQGKFLDTTGALVLTDRDEPHPWYSVFEGREDQKPCLLIANFSKEERTVSFSFTKDGEVLKYRSFSVYSVEDGTRSLQDNKIALPARSIVAVLPVD